MSNTTDALLFQKIKQSDQKSLEILYEKYFHILCEFAFSVLKQYELSEEVVSDVFFNIWNKRKEIDIALNLKSYLFKSVRNKALDYLNSSKIRIENIESHNITELMNDSTTIIEYQELENEINNLIELLPLQRRIIFKLNRFENLKYKEIAEIMSISVNTVQKQMTAATKFFLQYQEKIEMLLQ
jgi:RNA polymerase sigma-70 factor (ECF subfamily)